MIKRLFLIIFGLLMCFTVFPQGVNDYSMKFNRIEDSAYVNLTIKMDKEYSNKKYFLLHEAIEIQEIKVNENTVNYSRLGDTIFFVVQRFF